MMPVEGTGTGVGDLGVAGRQRGEAAISALVSICSIRFIYLQAFFVLIFNKINWMMMMRCALCEDCASAREGATECYWLSVCASDSAEGCW